MIINYSLYYALDFEFALPFEENNFDSNILNFNLAYRRKDCFLFDNDLLITNMQVHPMYMLPTFYHNTLF